MNYHVALDICVCFGEMLCAKLIRCHRTELIRAATLGCMGRPWLGLPVGSLMLITKEGRLCARGYPGIVRGDSLESWLLIGAPSLRGTKIIDNAMVGWHAMAGVSRGHRATQGIT